MIAALLGASGFVGTAVAAELRRQGHCVRQVRAPRLLSTAASAGEILAEASSQEVQLHELERAVSGTDVVINAAGLAAPGDPGSPALTGANALLPVLAALAAERSSVGRFVHISSAAVQGHRAVIDESDAREPFSGYSRSKALGEEALRPFSGTTVIVRATSVQGPDRPTTASLVRIASSPLCSVAAPGTAPTPVSSISGLAAFVVHASTVAAQPPAVVLQPWERATVTSVLQAAGGRTPTRIPAKVCTLLLTVGYTVSKLLGQRLHGSLRRLELMWFGQQQEARWAEQSGFSVQPMVEATLREARTTA